MSRLPSKGPNIYVLAIIAVILNLLLLAILFIFIPLEEALNVVKDMMGGCAFAILIFYFIFTKLQGKRLLDRVVRRVDGWWRYYFKRKESG